MKYRLPELEDKEEIIKYVAEHYANGNKTISASSLLTTMKYEDWVKKIHDNVNIPDEKWGKSFTYLAFNDEERLVGLLSIRYDLSKEMSLEYGDIGYGVRPSERRKGYATQMLQYALKICKEKGKKKVYIGCYKDNIASAKNIKNNGGQLIRETEKIKEISEYWKIKIIDQLYEIKLS